MEENIAFPSKKISDPKEEEEEEEEEEEVEDSFFLLLHLCHRKTECPTVSSNGKRRRRRIPSATSHLRLLRVLGGSRLLQGRLSQAMSRLRQSSPRNEPALLETLQVTPLRLVRRLSLFRVLRHRKLSAMPELRLATPHLRVLASQPQTLGRVFGVSFRDRATGTRGPR